jgi:hypothetical protein
VDNVITVLAAEIVSLSFSKSSPQFVLGLPYQTTEIINR